MINYKKEIDEITKYIENFFFFSSINELEEAFNNSRKYVEAVCKLYLYVKFGTVNTNITTSVVLFQDNAGNDVFLYINGIDYVFAYSNKPNKKLSLEELKHVLNKIYSDYGVLLKPSIEKIQYIGNKGSHSSGGRTTYSPSDYSDIKIIIENITKWFYNELFSLTPPNEIIDITNGLPVNYAKRYAKYQDLISEKLLYLNKISQKENSPSFNSSIIDTDIIKWKEQILKIEKDIEFIELQTNKLITQFQKGDFENTQAIFKKAYDAFIYDADIEKAISFLDEQTLNNSEFEISRNRLLKAELLLTKLNLNEATENFEKSISIFPYYDNLMKYSVFLYEQKRYEDALKYYRQGLNNSKTDVEKAEFHNGIGVILSLLPETEIKDAHNEFIYSIQIYCDLSLNDKEKYLPLLSRSIMNLGSLYLQNEKFDLALEYYEKAQNFTEISMDLELKSYGYNSLKDAILQGYFPKHSTSLLLDILMNKSSTLIKLGKERQADAMLILNFCKDIYFSYFNQNHYENWEYKIAITKINIAIIQTNGKNYDIALQNCLEAKIIIEKISRLNLVKYLKDLAIVYSGLGHNYFYISDLNNSEQCLNKSIEYYKLLNDKNSKKEYNECIDFLEIVKNSKR